LQFYLVSRYMLINSAVNYNSSFLLSPAVSYFDLYTVLSNKCAQDCFTFTNRCTYLLVLESTKIYIKICTRMLLHVSVYDHHQGACIWAY